MAIPDFQTIMRPVLGLILDEEMHRRDCAKQIASDFHLTQDEVEELLPSGKSTRLQNYVDWAIAYMSKAGLVQRPRSGYAIATAAGRKAYEDNPKRIDMSVLAQFPGYIAFRTPGKNTNDSFSSGQAGLTTGESQDSLESTPTERLHRAYEELNLALRDDLQVAIRSSSFTFFEHLIVDLMRAMGYGGPGSTQHLGRSGDNGVDGVINQDHLGLDRVYLQAKRYTESPVGPDQIDQFAGALGKQKATKGVFVTASRFTTGARDAADKSDKHIRLIDGEELARLLIDHNVGVVRDDNPLYIKQVDKNYFSE
ncbi:MAG: restriction endonuclease [Chloroflexi bacterium]|nr:restriction endonuclease [Chloroflexota bacterium]